LKNRGFTFEPQNVALSTGDFLQCAPIKQFQTIDTESDIMGPHVRMMWQNKSFAEVDRMLHVGPIKIFKK
jgi:hypothetical protein